MSAGASSAWRQAGLAVLIVGGAYLLAHQISQSPIVGKAAPDFGLQVVAGDPLDGRPWFQLSEMAGRVVVLDFWASWCEACRASTPMLNEVATKFRDEGVAFVGVNVEPVRAVQVREAHASFGAGFPSVGDVQGTVQRAFAVRVLPTIVVIDRGGVVSYAAAGSPSEGTLSSAISSALQ